ncbi:unnamed protein product [Ophioblennius macclurei]
MDPVSEADTDPVQEEDGDVDPEADMDLVPEADMDLVPEVDQDPVPEVDRDSVPETDQHPVPEEDQDPIPEADQDLVPEVDQDPVPEVDRDSVPEIDQHPVPEEDQDPIPEADQDLVPEADMDLVLEAGRDLVPEADQELVPEADRNPVLEADRDLVPEVGRDLVPEADRDPATTDINRLLRGDSASGSKLLSAGSELHLAPPVAPYRMAGAPLLPGRAPVAFGRLAVPLLFSELQQPHSGTRLRVLASLLDLIHDPERLYQTVTGGFLQQLQVLLKDEEPSVRRKTCELLQLVGTHSLGRQAMLTSSLLPPLCELLEDSCASCRRSALRVLELLTQLPAGANALLTLVPRLMLKLKEQQQEEEEEVLLLSIIGSCSWLDAVPALDSHGVSVLRSRLTHRSHAVRREAAAAMMALSVPVDGKRQVCEEDVLPLIVTLLKDEDVEVQANAVGVIMNTVIITTGKQQCLTLDVIPVLLHLFSEPAPDEEEPRERRRRRTTKALLLYSLRALSALADAPAGRHLLLEHLPLLVRRGEDPEEDPDVQQAAQTTIRAITWTP